MAVETMTAKTVRGSSWKKLGSMREAGLIAIILALCIAMSFVSPHFLTLGNFRAMLMSFSVEGIVVVGMTILLIVGGIDLAVGSVVCFAMVLSGTLFLVIFPDGGQPLGLFPCICSEGFVLTDLFSVFIFIM